MGSMSASDAAPLPRLGEIFFDVRGGSRSMRLSWFSDTGAAVFSIWQGGTCTGTFRLPLDDLARLVDSLRRGAPGQGDGAAAQASGQRPRLAIGAAPAEPFTGMMAVLPDDGAPTGPQAFGAAQAERYGAAQQYGTPQPHQAGPQASPRDSYGDQGQYRADGQYRTGDQYIPGDQYAAGQQYGTGPQHDGAQYGQYQPSGQYGDADQYGDAGQYGNAGQPAQYGDAGEYGDSGQGGEPRPGVDAQPGGQRADYQYDARRDARYDGGAGYGEAGQPGQQRQELAQQDGYGGAARYQAPQPSDPASSYGTGPQDAFGFPAPTGQQSYDGQPASRGYGDLGQAGGPQPGNGAPPMSAAQSGTGQLGTMQPGSAYPAGAAGADGEGPTGPLSAARYAERPAYGQPPVLSYAQPQAPAPAGEPGPPQAAQQQAMQQQAMQQQAMPSRDGQAGQGYGQPYEQPGYDENGYAVAGQAQDHGYGAYGQQAEQGYGQGPDQQGYAPQARQQWPDDPQSGQPVGAPGYQAGAGASALSAPVPSDAGAAGPQRPGTSGAQPAAPMAGQSAGPYGQQGPEIGRYPASYGEQGYAQPPGYQQAPAAETDWYPGQVGAGSPDGRPAGTGGYPPQAPAMGDGYAYDPSGRGVGGPASVPGAPNGDVAAYGDVDRAGGTAFTGGYPVAAGAGAGAYSAPGTDGFQAGGNGAGDGFTANGHAGNGYGPGGYQANGQAAGSYPADGQAARGQAASDGHPHHNGAQQGGYQAPADYGQARADGAVPTFTPTFTAHGAAGAPAEPNGTGRPGAYPMPGYGPDPSGGQQAYGPGNDHAVANGQAANGYASPNGEPAGFPPANGNGNGYAPMGNGNGYAPSGNGTGQGHPPNGNGYGAANGNAAGYPAANGNAAGYLAANGNGDGHGYGPNGDGDGHGFARNGNGYGAPNGNAAGYLAANGDGDGHRYAPNGNSAGQGHASNGNGYGAANGNAAGYLTANGNGYGGQHGDTGYPVNGNGYGAPNGAPAANGYQQDDYVSSGDYPPDPGFAYAGEADEAQQGYWASEQPPRGNWP